MAGELRGLKSHVHNSDGGRGNSSDTASNTDSEREETVVPRDENKGTASATPSPPSLVADTGDSLSISDSSNSDSVRKETVSEGVPRDEIKPLKRMASATPSPPPLVADTGDI